jgi:hypothetical protein
MEPVADDNPELEQFTANSLCTAELVLSGYPGDEILHLTAEPRARTWGSALAP